MISRTLGVAAAAGLALALGCGGSPPPKADPDQARSALRQALEAWKAGETPDDLLKRDPPLRVLDPDWRAGAKLTAYEIGKDSPFAAELRVSVVLTMRRGGKAANAKKAVYAVGTSPSLTVAREEDP